MTAQVWTLIALLAGGQVTIMIALFTLRGEVGNLRADLHSEVGSVRAEVSDLRGEMREFRGETHGEFTVIRSRLDHLEPHPA